MTKFLVFSESYLLIHDINILGCCHTRPRKGGYDICQNNDEETARTVENDDDLSEEDFTLRTVESLEVDAMLSKLSPIKGKTNQSQSGSKVVTSTPRKKERI